jgi:threonine/homoserine/homoserine lactone efflux protein
MMASSSLFTSGIVLGLSAGLSPGPLMTLVITETLKRGIPAGARIAAAPLITDPPIIAGSVLLLAALAQTMLLVGGIAILGGLYIAWLGYENIRFNGTVFDTAPSASSQLRKGIIANLLNPNPYVFWLSVGGPLILKTIQIGWADAALFLCLFYGCLVGSKLIVAVAVGRSRQFLRSNTYIGIIRSLGILLVVFAGFFFKEGLGYLGWP